MFCIRCQCLREARMRQSNYSPRDKSYDTARGENREHQPVPDEHLLLVPERRRHSRGGRLCPEERAPTRRVGTHDHARVVRTSYVSLIGRK